MSELDKLKDQIAGPNGWVYIEKFKILEYIELWMIAKDLVAASHNTAKPAFQRTLQELRRVVDKLG